MGEKSVVPKLVLYNFYRYVFTSEEHVLVPRQDGVACVRLYAIDNVENITSLYNH